MNKRSPQSGNVEPPPLPPIPDGGLGTAMPDWLRRPPAWRGLQEPAHRPKVVPPPDMSPIDPRTLLTVDDLPGWLRQMATSHPATAPEDVAPPGEGDMGSPTGHEPAAALPDGDGEAPLNTPGSPRGEPVPMNHHKTIDGPIPLLSTPPSHSGVRQRWRAGPVATLLFVCLVVAVMIIVMYAMNVF